MLQLVQVLGALAILVAFALAQFGVLRQRSYLFLVLNLVGSAVLAVLAYVEEQWGFLLLESVWALVSGWGLHARARRRCRLDSERPYTAEPCSNASQNGLGKSSSSRRTKRAR